MKLELPLSLASPQGVIQCLHELKQVQDGVRSADLAARSGSNAHSGAHVGMSAGAQELLKDADKPAQPSLTELGLAINYLQKIQDDAPVVTLTVAAPLSPADCQKVAHWFQADADKVVLCRFTVDPQIAGGVVVRTPHYVHDYSYATQLHAQTPALLKEMRRG